MVAPDGIPRTSETHRNPWWVVSRSPGSRLSPVWSLRAPATAALAELAGWRAGGLETGLGLAYHCYGVLHIGFSAYALFFNSVVLIGLALLIDSLAQWLVALLASWLMVRILVRLWFGFS